MVIKKEILDDLLKGCKNPEDLLGEEGVFKQLKKALLERALNAELDDHLGYEKGDAKGRNKKNSRNGHGSKRLLGEKMARWNSQRPEIAMRPSILRSLKRAKNVSMASMEK